MNQTLEQETVTPSAAHETSQSYTALQAAVEKLSVAQLDLYLHEIEWILSQLEETPYTTKDDKKHPRQAEVYEHFIAVEEKVFALKDVLVLERAKRSVLHLQELIIASDEPGE